VLLPHQGIREALNREYGLKVYPLEHGQIRPASIDLRLHPHILRYSKYAEVHVDPKKGIIPAPAALKMNEEDGWVLDPGDWILGATYEEIEIPGDLVGILCGKSSWARLGISIEDAGYVDPGWKGRLTLEIKNNGPLYVTLHPMDVICQLRLEQLTQPTVLEYGDIKGSHYQHSQGPVMSMYNSPRQIGTTPTLDEFGRPDKTQRPRSRPLNEDEIRKKWREKSPE
jgi:dCTP deaminase